MQLDEVSANRYARAALKNAKHVLASGERSGGVRFSVYEQTISLCGSLGGSQINMELHLDTGQIIVFDANRTYATPYKMDAKTENLVRKKLSDVRAGSANLRVVAPLAAGLCVLVALSFLIVTKGKRTQVQTKTPSVEDTIRQQKSIKEQNAARWGDLQQSY